MSNLSDGSLATRLASQPAAQVSPSGPAVAAKARIRTSSNGERNQQDQTAWSPYRVWTEESPLDDRLSAALDGVMQTWRLTFDMQGKRNGPTNLAEAHGILWESVNMAVEGAPLRSVEYRGVFFFSGGTRAYRVNDFSSGYAIPKGKAAIYRWGD